MSVVRVNKTKNYTVMSNYHLRDKNMSLKAIGLLSKMLSLPDNWDYSVAGLVSICVESKTAIQNILKELEELKYLKRTRVQNSKGQFEYIYDIFEQPYENLPRTENLCTGNQCTGNQSQLNTKELSTKKLNTNSFYYSSSKNTEAAINTEGGNKIGSEKEKNKESNKVSDILGESRIYKWSTHMGESDCKKIITLIDSYIKKYSYQGDEAKRLIQTMGDMVDMRIKNDEEGKGTYCMTAYGMQVILDTLDKVCPSGDISYKIECLNQAIDDRSDNVRPIKRANKKGFSYSDNIHRSNNKYSKYDDDEDNYDIYAVIGQKYKPNNDD